MTSVWSFRDLADFRQFIRNLVNRSMTMSYALAGFRELCMLPKELGQLTVEEVSTKTELIEKIYRALKKMKAETVYKLPYDKEEREKEIIDNISESYDINKTNTHCKILTGYHKDGERQFTYAIEIALASLINSKEERAGYVTFIGSVNDTPAIDGGEKYFESNQYAYSWKGRKGKEYEVRSAMDVLNSVGFNPMSQSTSRQRIESVAYVNVKTDVPDWLGAAGKTYMNQLPYAATIAKTLVSMAHKIPSYRGQGIHRNSTSSSSYHQKSAKEYVEEFLKQRRIDVEADSNVRIDDRLTQRGVAYRLRPKMMNDGFEPGTDWPTTMKTITDMISERCKELWPDENIDREHLGIFAKARGMFYYRGRTTPIDFNIIENLASKAAVNIVIEKEGLPAVLAPYADKYRIALISTQGNFTDYVKRFISCGLDEDAVIVTILDDDRSGRKMADSTYAINIGVNENTVEWLRTNGYPSLSVEDIHEIDPSTIREGDPSSGEYRIEIDSIIAEVGAEGIWKYIIHKLKELAPLDLVKAIDMPANEELYTEKIVESLTYMSNYAGLVTNNAREEIERKLNESYELYDVGEKEAAIKEDLIDILENDEGMKMLAKELPELITKLKDFESSRPGR